MITQRSMKSQLGASYGCNVVVVGGGAPLLAAMRRLAPVMHLVSVILQVS